VLVSQVVEGSPAEEAGLSDGDVIIKFGGTEVEDVSHIRQLIQNKGAGEHVELKIIRGGEIKELTAVLGAAKPAYGYSWMTDWGVPKPPETPQFYYEATYDYMQQVQDWKDRDKKVLNELREELNKLAHDMKKLSEELERLKRERSKE